MDGGVVILTRKYKIGVMGSAGEPEDSEVGRLSYRIGREIAIHGAFLFTGGCPGLPHCATLGARESGGNTIAISPAMNRLSHLNDFCYPLDSDATIFTGMGNKGRNVVLVRSCDACIFVSGGMGTLNEFTIAYDDFCETDVIGVLSGSGGLSDKYLELANLTRKKSRATIIADGSPESLVRKIIDILNRADMSEDRC